MTMLAGATRTAARMGRAPGLGWVAGLVRRGAVGLASRSGTLDLSRVEQVPESLAWPLRREGLVPSERLRALGAEDPVHRLTSFVGMRVWLVTGHAESRAVLADAGSYSTDIRPYVGRRGRTDGDIGGLGFTDPPDHTRLRRMLTPELTMRALGRMRPLVELVVERQLDEVADAARGGGEVDLVPTFAFPVPFLVICDLLGLPDRRREEFRALGSARFDVSGGGYGTFGAISGSREFLLEEVRRQRVEPGPGLIGRLLAAHGDDVDDRELAGLADGVFTGGLETSASMLALGAAVLLEDRPTWRGLAAGSTPVEPVVEELLRLLSVVQVAFPRFVRREAVVGGVTVRPGDVVLVSLPAADHDERLTGPGATRFDPARGPAAHLAFGHGLHRCVGAELARLELRTAYAGLAARFGDLRLVAPPEVSETSLVLGVDRVLVRTGA